MKHRILERLKMPLSSAEVDFLLETAVFSVKTDMCIMCFITNSYH